MNTVSGTNIRFAQFNASLNRNADGQLINDLSNPAIPDTRAIGAADNPNRNQALRIQQAKNAAEIIQRNNPDVLLINEFDFNTANPAKAVELFINNFLKVGQNGASPVDYKYFYIAPSNTGISSGFDLNNNGSTVNTLTDGIGDAGYGDDSFGFGNFPGQFGMVVLSKYEIDTANVRTFQNFLWKDMPGGLLTNDPTVDNPATPVNENLNGFYSAAEIDKLRLSSKSHWDVPIKVNGEIVHALVSHPTPPVFDGTEDRNGKRNADEIRFWADYVSPGQGGYIYDDKGGKGGIAGGSSFVIMGDQNADPRDGDSYNNAVSQLLRNPNINTNSIPTSAGGVQQSTLQGLVNNTQTGNPAFDTADFADSGTNPGNLRADYVLPSADLTINNSGVFWPLNTDPTFAPVGVFNATLPGGYAASDHRLVFADVQVGVTPSGKSIASASFVGQKILPTGFIPTGAAGKINGVDVPLGGLSGVTYDAAKNQYYAISDDRTPNARFYTFTLNPVTSDVTFTNVVQLKDASGNPFALNSLDPEGIALTQNGTVFISSEGEVNPSVGRVSNPFIKEFSLTTGTEIRSLAVPTKFLPKVTDTNGNSIVDAPDTQTAGVRNNLAFESLTISPDKKTLYTATENALFQDGDRATVTAPSRSRIVQYNLATGQPEKEYLYNADPIAKAPNPATGGADSGLVDLLAIDDRGTFLALERSFAVGQGNTIKVYEVTLQGATDISAIDLLNSLTATQLQAIAPVQKRLILDLDSLKLPNSDGNHPTGTDNIEGLAFGPKLADGRQSIVLVSDNNFSATQFTQIITLSADLVPTATPMVETPSVLDSDSPFTAKPLNILLVNDDGYQAPGLDTLYKALIAAGHKVTIVAPKSDQSGIGTAIDTDKIFRQMEVVNYAPGKWYVDGTPVTTTLAALDSILKTTPPDLVISGINRGENTGNTAVSSGTVGAAIAAIQKGIPAFAVSAGISLSESAQGFPSTTRAYEIGARYIVDTIAELQATQGNNRQLLPAGKGLNINIPIGNTVKGVSYTEFDSATSIGFTFGTLPNNSAAQGLQVTIGSLPAGQVPNPTSEGQQFLAGRLTVTPLDGSWNTTSQIRQAIDDRVNDGVTPPAGRSLKIMLVNDDGYQAAGIQKLYAGLVAAGHQVTIVAPKVDQSGRGTSINTNRISQPMEVVNVSPNQWYVDGTPFTTSIAGIDSILKNSRPDLVISGINQGENIGNTATSSGTVGAAVAALQRGIPAIAVSAGILLAESAQGFPSTQPIYDVATKYVVNLIGQLQATQGSGSLLPAGVGLNVNVPVTAGVRTTAFTEFDSATSLEIGFGAVPGGGTGLIVTPKSPAANPKPFSEGEQFLAGKTTVTPFDGDWSSSDRDRELVANGLNQFLTGDADDPAIWVDPRNSVNSLVIAALKDGGLVTLNLDGSVVQDLSDRPYGSLRYNNVDVLYNFKLGTQTVDLAIVTDRRNDTLGIFKIDPATRQLVEITDTNASTVFQAAPFTPPYSTSSISAYGIANYRSPITGDSYVFVNRRQTGDIAQLKLVDKGNGKIGYELVRNFTIPAPTRTGASPQTEGMVADQETGLLYIGQEDVGIWKYNAEPTGGKFGTLIEKVKAEGGKNLTNDVEGLTIYYGKNGTGYLLASSQGDNTFAAYTREGNNEFIGRFGVGNNGSIDSVQESDGAEVINLPLGANFPNGLFITQDGSNDPAKIVAGENISSNFKFVPFENIANTFPTPLKIDTTSYNPRNPVARLGVVESAFPNGVASGDTTQNSTVLWTRSNVPGKVTFEYSTKADFSSIAGTQAATVTDTSKPVKVDVTGLSANTNYFYRVTDANGTKAAGKFSTAAALGEKTGLKFGVSGDWRGELAPYPAINNADDANLKFFIELGDTVYADVRSPAVKNPDGTEKSQATTIGEFRAKHAEVYGSRYGQNTWGDLRASTSILASIDDHEITNDFAGGQNLATSTAAQQALYSANTGLVNDSPLYENGLQAFQEYNPLRDLTYNTPSDSRTDGERKLYRYNTYGSDAATFVLDARSFRDRELAGVTNTNDIAQVTTFLTQSFDPSRTMLGKPQVADLKRDLLQAQKDGVTWKFVNITQPIANIGVLAAGDRFEGYAAERTELLKFINDNNIDNVVFVTADFHGTLINNLTYQTAPGGAQIATSAFEVITGSVAYDKPFGPTVAELAAAAGIISPAQKAQYDALPDAGKNTFIKNIIDGGLNSLGYDPLGLDKNLAQANGLINAKLLQGDYVAANTYGWTEFDIDKVTQKLIVTTYGVDAYNRAQLEANPSAIIGLTPKVISQFEVTPNNLAPTLVSGTAGNDNLIAGITPGFGGFNDNVFTGSGNDSVDVPIAGAKGGNNRIDLGSGNDIIYVGNLDRAFGSTGDDEFNANDAKDYRISAGTGNDTLFLGTNGRALGGEGNDKFFVGTGGSNLLSGGAGADQFWIYNGEAPTSANTIVDFQIGTDVIGFTGGVKFTDLTRTGNNIAIGGNTIATLTGVETNTLTAANFAFI